MPRLARWFLALALATLALVIGAIATRRWALNSIAGSIARRDYRAAESTWTWARWIPPESTGMLVMGARIDRLQGRYPQAEEKLARASGLAGGPTMATQVEYLLMRAQTGEEDEVASMLEAHVEQNHPESPLILETLSRAYMHRLRYGPAHAALTRLIEKAPASPLPRHWRGWVLERLGNAKAAMADYQKALELDPGITEVRLRVAAMLLEDKLPQEARTHIDQLLAQHPGRADILVLLGQCLYLSGDSPGARRELEKAEVARPDDPILLLHLARLDLLEGLPEKAVARLRRALAADPADVESQYTLVGALRQLGRDDEARAMLERYEKQKEALEKANQLLKREAETPSRDPAPAREIAQLLLNVGQPAQAAYWFDQALVRDPADRETHRLLAERHEALGDTQRAARHRKLAGDSR